jgi:hypothetical protein
MKRVADHPKKKKKAGFVEQKLSAQSTAPRGLQMHMQIQDR